MFQCRKRHYHVHNIEGLEGFVNGGCFNAASGITMCTTHRKAAEEAALDCFNAASGITMCTTAADDKQEAVLNAGFNAASGITMCTTYYFWHE